MGIASPFIYSYINARIRARKSELFSEADIYSLLDSELKEFYEKNDIKEAKEKTIFNIKRDILNKYYDYAISISKKAPVRLQKISRAYLLKFPLSEYKSALRISREGEIKGYSDLILFDDLIVALKKDDSSLYKINDFSRFKRFNVLIDSGKDTTLLELESALDNDYFDNLFDKFSRSSRNDKKDLEKFIYFFIDSENLLNLLRQKFNYNVSIEDCMLQFFHRSRFSRKLFIKALSEDNIKDALSLFSESKYSYIAESDSVIDLERKISLKKEEIAKAFLYKNVFSPGILIAYFWLLESEFRKIDNILEAKLLDRVDIIRSDYVQS